MAVLKFKDPDTLEWKEISVVSDGVTFIPQISEDGELSWSNNGHLDNPAPYMLDSNGVVIKNLKSEFPAEGDKDILYIERKTNSMYRWDVTSLTYVSVGGGGGTEVAISEKEGNILVAEDDGLYVPSTPVQVSKEEGNLIKNKDDGLYSSVEYETENIDFSKF